MDTLRFEKFDLHPWWTEEIYPGVKILINGQPLLEIIEAHEGKLAALGIMEQPTTNRYTYAYAQQLFNEINDPDARTEDDLLEVLICSGCLHEGCCPVYATVVEKEDCVIWKDFSYGHLHEYPKYQKFGCYKFDKTAYWNEVERLKTFYQE